MNVRCYTTPNVFEFLPSLCIAKAETKTQIQYNLMFSWGTFVYETWWIKNKRL